MEIVGTMGHNGFFAALARSADGRFHYAAITRDICPKTNPGEEYHVAVYTRRKADVAALAELAIEAHQRLEADYVRAHVGYGHGWDVSREKYTRVERWAKSDYNAWFGDYYRA